MSYRCNENRISERLRGIASDMRNIGASSMTPRELFAYWAGEVDKAADLADFMCGLNRDGLPYGLTISDDGDLLNWRGENYFRQGSGMLTAEQVRPRCPWMDDGRCHTNCMLFVTSVDADITHSSVVKGEGHCSIAIAASHIASEKHYGGNYLVKTVAYNDEVVCKQFEPKEIDE